MGRGKHVIHKMAGATIHRQAFEGAWVDWCAQRFDGIDDDIADIRIVDVATIV